MALCTYFEQTEIGCPGTRCGLPTDLSFLIDFYGLTLFAAGGLNNGGVNGNGFLTIQVLFDRLPINHLIQLQ